MPEIARNFLWGIGGPKGEDYFGGISRQIAVGTGKISDFGAICLSPYTAARILSPHGSHKIARSGLPHAF